MDYAEWFPKRMIQLRTQKGVSARDMSLSLGQSVSYINKIENSYAMPSMLGFLYICEYFGVTPQEFFNEDLTAPMATKQIATAAEKLNARQAEHVLQIIRDITEK